MNIVQLIMDQISSMGLGKLSALLGLSEDKTGAAVGTAVPALLSGLSSMASTGDGAQKLASAFGKFDAGSLGNMLSGQAGAAAEQGGSMLSSLFGNTVMTGISAAVSKFTGLSEGVTKMLLGYLTPLIMGTLAKQFAGKAITPQGLTSMFAEQKNNISSAMPSGLSLANIPSLASMGSAARAVQSTANAGYGAAKDAGSSALKWLLPLLGLVAAALLAYLVWPKSTSLPDVPDVASVTKSITGDFSSLTSALAGIKDAASAEAAVPKLMEFSGKLDGMKAMIDKLPEAGRSAITEMVRSNMGKLANQFSGALMIPGVTDKLRPVLEAISGKFASMVGLPATQFALPSVEVTDLGSELSRTLGSLTSVLTGVKDATTADAAIPKLKDVGDKLGMAKGSWDRLPEGGKSTISSVLKPVLVTLKALVSKVLALPIIGDKLKPTIEPILSTLASFGY